VSEEVQPESDRPRGVAVPPRRRGHLMDVLRALAERGPAQYEPDRISADAEVSTVEIRFVAEATGVVMWAKALGFGTPKNHVDNHLHQVLVEAWGDVLGWTVELRHVHTAVMSTGRPVIHAQPVDGPQP
jgi:hypothetical protein